MWTMLKKLRFVFLVIAGTWLVASWMAETSYKGSTYAKCMNTYGYGNNPKDAQPWQRQVCVQINNREIDAK